MFGGTPSNLAISVMDSEKIEVVAGVNLPMLIKMMSIRDKKSIKDIIAISQESGRKYINVASAFFEEKKRLEQKKVERKILITNKLGIHARAAAKFVELTSKCGSKFIVKKGSKVVNGSSLLGLMTLAASKGTEIKVQCIGSNSEKDLNKLISLIKNNFGEERPLSENTDKELVLKGIGVSSGYAIGSCFVKQKTNLSNIRYNISISSVQKEIIRLEKAVKVSILDIKKIIKKITIIKMISIKR